MKKTLIITSLLAITLLASCKNSTDTKNTANNSRTAKIESESQDNNKEVSSGNKLFMSNMNSKESLNEVTKTLKKHLKSENVDKFEGMVKEYNEAVEGTTLNGEFQKISFPNYDLGKIDELWQSKEGNFIGTNCRINTFTLLKDNVKFKEIPYDDSMLFLDQDEIDYKNIFDKDDRENFLRLFSSVPTENTTDYHVHAKNMEKHLSNFTFDKDVKMISVVVHDDIDEDILFIGHTGVLVPQEDHFIWIEKLNFQEPYQAIKFKNETDCCIYLYEKYKAFTTDTTSAPFIMENDKLVELTNYSLQQDIPDNVEKIGESDGPTDIYVESK